MIVAENDEVVIQDEEDGKRRCYIKYGKNRMYYCGTINKNGIFRVAPNTADWDFRGYDRIEARDAVQRCLNPLEPEEENQQYHQIDDLDLITKVLAGAVLAGLFIWVLFSLGGR